jgi:hypothetical protein
VAYFRFYKCFGLAFRLLFPPFVYVYLTVS